MAIDRTRTACDVRAGTPRRTRALTGATVAAVGFALGAALVSTPVHAQSPIDARWLPWVACWESVPEADAGAERTLASVDELVCVQPDASGAGVEIVTYAGSEPVSRAAIVADGERRPIEQSGCSGWESAEWAPDGVRVYLRSELLCEGGIHQRRSSGLLAILPRGEWLDARVVIAGEDRAVLVRRFRPAGQERIAAAGIADPSAEREFAVATARSAASRRLSVSDVIEAASHVEPEVVEALLVERGGGFVVDAASVLAMADAGVPDALIDLSVALSFPDRFEVDRATRQGDFRTAAAEDMPPIPAVAGPRHDPYFGPPGYGYGYDPYLHPYGYGRGYLPYGMAGTYGWWLGPRGGTTVVIREVERGAMVKGRGYSPGRDSERAVRPRSGSNPQSSVTPARRGGSTASDQRSRGASTGRKAKPRSQGGSDR